LAEHYPKEYIERGQLYFGFEVDEGMLAYVLEEFGDECWLYASDIPHRDRLFDNSHVLQERTDIGEETKRKLLIDNTARFYGLDVETRQPLKPSRG
jgi:predicted TIM-barrel fold metal-dependent hydrolase